MIFTGITVLQIMFFCSLLYIHVWLISLLMLASVVANTNNFTILITGGVFGVVHLIGLVTKIKGFLPVVLISAGELINGLGDSTDYKSSIIVCVVFSLINVLGSVLVFNKKINL